MCGIVGIFTKNPQFEQNLGQMLASMLVQMTDRGPDSAGFAIYHNPVKSNQVKFTLKGKRSTDWNYVIDSLQMNLDLHCELSFRANYCNLIIHGNSDKIANWLIYNFPSLKITSIGSSIEIYKEIGLPHQVINLLDLQSMSGTHALGHTRMATESVVTSEHSHPFNTGLDLCLVHNGSLSNHNQLREQLQSRGIRFQTDNDSEVAAGYFTWRIAQGATLKEALESAIDDLDGFYTFAIGTKNGFAVIRDPIACKPAIIAETDDWVAMASEYRAIAQLPGNEHAKIWEPEPATIYNWERN